MIQELTKQELSDVSEVMLKTKTNFLTSKSTIRILILATVVFGVASVTFATVSIKTGQICLFLSMMSLAVMVYIVFYRRGLKKNIQNMISKRIGIPMEVNATKDYITYNGQKYPIKKIEKAIEYRGLFYLVIGNAFMVMKKDCGIGELCENNPQIPYVRYKKPFNLFNK